MSGLSKSRKIIQVLVVSGLLSSCSVVDWYRSDTVKADTDIVKISNVGWSYQKNVPVNIDNTLLSSGLGIDQASLSASCEFQPEVKRWLDAGERGVLLPAMAFAEDFTFAPDLSKSATLYKILDQHIRLGSASDSLRSYNMLLSSIEHTCPDNMSRDMESCQFRKWMSFTGFSSNDQIYEGSRIDRWLIKNSDVDYFIMGSAELFNSKAMLNSRYSAHSRVLTNKKSRVREKMVRPFLGKIRYDWVKFDESGSPLFTSYGYCEIHWSQLELLRAVKGSEWKTVEQFEAVSDFMFPHFIEFMNSAARDIAPR